MNARDSMTVKQPARIAMVTMSDKSIAYNVLASLDGQQFSVSERERCDAAHAHAPERVMKWVYAAVLALLLASCAFGLGGCITITLYPEYMTGSCIGMACRCSNDQAAPDTNGKTVGREQFGRLLEGKIR